MAPPSLKLSGRVALAGPIAEVERFGGHDLDDVHVLAAWEADWREIERCAAVLERQAEGQRRLVEGWAREVRTMLLDPGVEELVARVADALDAHGELDETLFEDCLGEARGARTRMQPCPPKNTSSEPRSSRS